VLRVLSFQVRSDARSSQCATAGLSSGWWNAKRNDILGLPTLALMASVLTDQARFKLRNDGQASSWIPPTHRAATA